MSKKLTPMDWGLIAALVALALLASGITIPSAKDEITPAVESPSNGGLISQEELKAAGDKLVAGATDFGSDCAAAEDYFHATGGDARCKQEGSDLEVIISSEALPQDPAELSAEQPAAP